MLVPIEQIITGNGPRVVFVHGSIVSGTLLWNEQIPLSEKWTIVTLNRRGYGNSPEPSARSDFEEDANDIANSIHPGDHLVGFSYGAVASLFAAAKCSNKLRSLTLIEPPAFGIVADHPGVKEMIRDRVGGVMKIKDPVLFYDAFRRMITGPDAPPLTPIPDPLPPALERGIRTTMAQRDPSEASPPMDLLKATTFPKLIVSGGHHPAFEAVCDLLHQNSLRSALRLKVVVTTFLAQAQSSTAS